MSSPPSPRPGWYPDPHVAQQMRWWDGAGWTEDTYERTEPLEDWTAARATVSQTATARTAATRSAAGRRAITDDGVLVAGWWSRAAARIIDGLITGVLAWVIGFSQARVFFSSLGDQFSAAMRAAESGTEPPPFAYDGKTLTALAIISLVWLGISLVYDLVFLLWKAATPGKLALGLRVRRWTPDLPLTAGVVLRRWLAFEAASALSYIGTIYVILDVLWPLRDARRQALHDKFAGTCVVPARPNAS